jgi:exodeoxyribonuclease VII small subunit
MAMATEKNKPQGFEKSLERLEAVVAEMEGGDLSLEDMIKRFEEGQKLIGYCSKQLDEVERKIEKLVKKDNGEVKAVPFESEAPAAPITDEGEAELF